MVTCPACKGKRCMFVYADAQEICYLYDPYKECNYITSSGCKCKYCKGKGKVVWIDSLFSDEELLKWESHWFKCQEDEIRSDNRIKNQYEERLRSKKDG